MALSSFDVDKKYNVLQNIGKGSAGSVFLCKSKRDHKSYALKQIYLDKRKKGRSKDIVLREVLILQKLQHPHVVTYHEAFFDRKQDNLIIIQDYCAGGSLHEKVKFSRQKNTLISERQIMEWFVQVTMALRYIHNKRVLHRDLKTQNVFLTKTNMIKIGDFGIARVLEHTVDMASTCVGTPCYLSPEICQDKPYNSKSDIWALGCLLYELCALKPAFNASNLVSLCYKIVKGKYDHIPDQYSNLVKMLIEKSLQKCPEDRPTATTILNLPEVKEQLSVYITDKETERQSAHPAKRASIGGGNAVGVNKARRKTARPAVVNIGGEPKKRVVKKGPKKSPTNSGNGKSTTKKKKKKKPSEVNEAAEEVKKLPDEVLVANRPDSPAVAPGRLKDPFKPAPEDLPPILKHNAVVGYSPPTISRDVPQPATPRSFLMQDKDVFIKDFSTKTSDAIPRIPKVPPTGSTAGPPNQAAAGPPNQSAAGPPNQTAAGPPNQAHHTPAPLDRPKKSYSPEFIPPSSNISDNTPINLSDSTPPGAAPVDNTTYAKPPSTPLFRIPKPDKRYQKRDVISQDIQISSVRSSANDAAIPEENAIFLETDGEEKMTGTVESAGTMVSKTVEIPVCLTSPQVTNSVLSREEAENVAITPLPDITREKTFQVLDPASTTILSGFLPSCSNVSPDQTEPSETLPVPFSIGNNLLPQQVYSPDGTQQFLPGQIEVGWSIGEGTQGFVPQNMRDTITDTVNHLTDRRIVVESTIVARAAPVAAEAPDDRALISTLTSTIIDDNLNLNLDDVPDNQFPNVPEELSQDKLDEKHDILSDEEEITEVEEDYDYSDDFEEYEDNEIPDYENVEDIPDVTEPGKRQDEDVDSDEEDEEMFEMAMKSARVALDNIEEEEDEEFVEDFVMPSSAGNIAALRQYCVNNLGDKLFSEVQSVCREFEDNYDSHDTFVKKLEKLAGTEKLEICLIVDEFFVED